MQRRINYARNLVDKVESKCMLTSSNLRITVASHVFSHAGVCMQIQESTKGGVQYVYVWGHAVENF